MNKLIKRFSYYLLGSIFLSFGVILSILSKFGAGAFDALNNHLSKLLNISIGNAMYLSIFILFIITMILKPKKSYFVGLLLTGLISLGINMWFLIIPTIGQNIGLQLLYFCGALIFIPLGITFILKSKLPLSPVDNLLLILMDKVKWPISVLKTVIEGSFAVLAFICGILAGIGMGSLSIGTIIITFSIGPGIDFFMKFIKNIDKNEEKKIPHKVIIR